MMDARQELRITSDRLLYYFQSRAISAGVEINPVDWDEYTRNIVEILYAEESADRSFRVYPKGYVENRFHGFVTRVGIDRDNVLVGIFSALDEGNFSLIWDFYLKWMHERISEENIVVILAEANARFR